VPEALKNDIVLPFYSLIADRSPKPKWIDELFKSSKHASMNEFVWEDIVKPLLDMHATLMENGITSELHQQNICLTVDRKTGSIKGLLLKDMDGNWIDHSLRTHRLGKPSIHFSSFENDAYLFRYAMAPENHYDSYVDMLRERNIRNTFKFVLNPNELSELISASDKYLIGRFNRAFPEHKIDNISQYKNAWKKLSDASITPEERLVYERIRSTRKEVGVGAFLRRFYNRKLEASLTYPTGSLRDTTLCIIQALKANWK